MGLSGPSPYFAREIKIHQKMSTRASARRTLVESRTDLPYGAAKLSAHIALKPEASAATISLSKSHRVSHPAGCALCDMLGRC